MLCTRTTRTLVYINTTPPRDEPSPSPDSEPGSKRLKRAIKPLPPGLDSISPPNFSKIHCAVEVYTKGGKTLEASLAQYVDTEVSDNGVLTRVRLISKKA